MDGADLLDERRQPRQLGAEEDVRGGRDVVQEVQAGRGLQRSKRVRLMAMTVRTAMTEVSRKTKVSSVKVLRPPTLIRSVLRRLGLRRRQPPVGRS